jgi:hypothetical protein
MDLLEIFWHNKEVIQHAWKEHCFLVYKEQIMGLPLHKETQYV